MTKLDWGKKSKIYTRWYERYELPHKPVKIKKITRCTSDTSIYTTHQWKLIRNVMRKLCGYSCMCCGSKSDVHLVHILDIYNYPHLSFDYYNPQFLCSECKDKRSIDHKTTIHKMKIANYLLSLKK